MARRRKRPAKHRQDRIAIAGILILAFVMIPLFASQYWFAAILTPFLIFSLAALGLNILTGYAGQLSLGTAAFMAVGAFMAYNIELRVPWMPILGSFVKRTRSQGPSLRRRYPASLVLRPCPTPAGTIVKTMSEARPPSHAGLPQLHGSPFRHAVPTTPMDRNGCVCRLLPRSTPAFPVSQAGRRP